MLAGALTFTNRLEKSAVGIVRAVGMDASHSDPEFDRELRSLITERAGELPHELDHVRLASRDMLRNGRYKPTGRGKPASEYLIRAARDPESFPRVNWPVDVCNFISLKYVLPVSIWDVGAAASRQYLFRLGQEDEEYVFNTAGQVIALQDLAIGCSLQPDASADGIPIVNPVKDSMKTKTSARTTHVVAAVYAPAIGPEVDLDEVCVEFAEWLGRASTSGETSYCILQPGASLSC